MVPITVVSLRLPQYSCHPQFCADFYSGCSLTNVLFFVFILVLHSITYLVHAVLNSVHTESENSEFTELSANKHDRKV